MGYRDRLRCRCRAGSRNRSTRRRVMRVPAAGPAHREEAAERHRGREFVAGDRAGGPGLWPAALLGRLPRGRRGLSSEAPTEIHRPMTYTGRAVRRLEDADLLRGAGRFADDLPVRRDTLHAAILRSPHAHAEILSVDAEGALALPGVDCVVTAEDARRWTRPFAVAVKTAMQHWCLAVDRVRHVGEPVAVALARDRHTAEDVLERIAVRYRPLPPVVDAEKAAEADAPLLHPAVGSNVVSDRAFRYGDPEAAFVASAHRVSVTTRYPRNAASPLECFVVIAEYLPGEAAYEVTANFQGPFAMHPVMAMALGVPGNRLRLRTPPHSGGSFGAKHAVFPYIVLLALAARKAGRPVKWVESRLEHLTAATSATNRVTTLSAAVDRDGVVTALAWDQLEDCGAYLRAPEPATLYRMHANMTGAYRVRHLSIRNRVVLTNKTPSGLVRGFGGPQVYFALERLMQRIAATLGLDPLEVIRRNLVEAFPHRCPAGAILDSGDYRAAIHVATERGGLAQLRHRRDRARSEGGLYGIGFCRGGRAGDLEHGLYHDRAQPRGAAPSRA